MYKTLHVIRFSLGVAAIFAVTLYAIQIALHTQSQTATSRAKKHRVCFEVNVDGLETWQSIMNNVENLQKALDKDKVQIELVCHGKGLSMLLSTDSGLRDRMKAAADNGVNLAACENTMRRKNVKKEELPLFATTVPSGVTEVILKQESGWSYLKAGF